jgi:cytoskeletal protein CcmA (bactofilin family)
MKRSNIFILSALLICLLATPASALAAPLDIPLRDDKVVFQGTYTLESGETLSGSLLVLGGIVEVEEGALVTGDVVVLGGNVKINGELRGSLVAVAGVVSISDSVVIEGDLIAPASVVQRDDGAEIRGQIITNTGPITIPSFPAIPDANDHQDDFAIPAFRFRDFNPFQPVLEFMGLVLQALLFSALAVVTMILAPSHMQRTRNALMQEPIVSGGFGLFTLVVLVAAILFLGLLSVLVITIPFTALAMLLLAVGVLTAAGMGWFSIGAEIGERIANYFKQEWTPALHSGVGTFLLTVSIGLFGVIFLDFFGNLFGFLLLAVGIGAVLLTHFGTREYMPQSAIQDAGAESSE